MKCLLPILLLVGSSSALAETWPKTIKKYSVINHKLTQAIITVESAGNRKAVSSVGAKGLMQVTKIAVRDIIAHRNILPARCKRITLKTNLFRASSNILAGSCYFKLLEVYVGSSWYYRVASYNAGPGRVDRWKKGKSKLPKETTDYLIKVNSELRKLNYPEGDVPCR